MSADGVFLSHSFLFFFLVRSPVYTRTSSLRSELKVTQRKLLNHHDAY